MASIDKRPDGTYRVRWRETPGGPQRTKHFKLKRGPKGADAFKTQVENSLLTGDFVDPSDKTTVVELWRRRVADRAFAPITALGLEYELRALEKTKLGHMRVNAVRPSHCQEWVASQTRAGLAPASVASYATRLRTLFNYAIREKIIRVSPMTGVVLPTIEEKEIPALTVAQVQQLANGLPDHYRAMVLVQAGLGCRISELFALRVQDVDRVNREVRISEELDPITHERTTPKTPAGVRRVPLSSMVAKALAEHQLRYPPLEDGLLFYGIRHRRRFTYSNYSKRYFLPAVELAAAQDPTFPAGTTTHWLRHTFIAWQLLKGVPVTYIANWVGHKDAKMILEVYNRLVPDASAHGRRAIDETWAEGSQGVERGDTASGAEE